MLFIPARATPGKNTEQSFYLLIKNRDVILKPSQDGLKIPVQYDLGDLNLDLKQSHFIGLLNGHCCYAIDYLDTQSGTESLPESLQLVPLRETLIQCSSAEVQAISLAAQIVTWDKTFRFCGQCGQSTTELEDDRAKICSNCGLINYPRLSPSIIVSVVKDGHILLARSDRFPTGMYSVLAGFVEPGETLEQCVSREIKEEVGIEVTNISYFGSQNWPFPHSLMIGFTADHSCGEIKIDNREIVDAGWFKAEEMPKIPGSYSIARELIDHFANGSSLKK